MLASYVNPFPRCRVAKIATCDLQYATHTQYTVHDRHADMFSTRHILQWGHTAQDWHEIRKTQGVGCRACMYVCGVYNICRMYGTV